MQQRLRLGLIGAGGIATSAHLPGYQAFGDQVEFAAVADVNGERAQQVAMQFGFARVYNDYVTMLKAEQLDVVSICTPNKFHAAVAIAALGAGVHVLCEKPPARTAAEAEAMAEAARANNRILMYMFNNRFRPESQAASRFVESGMIGPVYAARARWLRRRGIPGWGVFTSKELQGGGPLIDLGVHMIDLALHLMGYPEPDLVVGSTYNHLGTKLGPAPWGPWDWQNFEIEDMALGFVRLKNGASIIIETSFMEHMEPMEEMTLMLSGAEGGLNVFPLKVFKDMNDTMVNINSAWLPVANGHHALIANFIAAIRGEAPPAVTPEEGVKLQRILDAIYHSAETGEAVKF
ncbi:MAG: oxidoreductase [Firmicutes bacterium]|nr:oxidoreductase [Bacillota bacterium]